jgi:hypothetical protein
MSIEEATVSKMWEMAAIVEVLGRFSGINEIGKHIAPNTSTELGSEH